MKVKLLFDGPLAQKVFIYKKHATILDIFIGHDKNFMLDSMVCWRELNCL